MKDGRSRPPSREPPASPPRQLLGRAAKAPRARTPEGRPPAPQGEPRGAGPRPRGRRAGQRSGPSRRTHLVIVPSMSEMMTLSSQSHK